MTDDDAYGKYVRNKMADISNTDSFHPDSLAEKRKKDRQTQERGINRSREPDSWHPPEHITKITLSPAEEKAMWKRFKEQMPQNGD